VLERKRKKNRRQSIRCKAEKRERERERFFSFCPVRIVDVCKNARTLVLSSTQTQITIWRQHTYSYSSCRCEGAVRSSKE